jgi:hypothetical protein
MNEVMLINSALGLVEALLPKIQEMARKGEISAEQQRELRARYDSLKAKADGQFTGPEWQIS